MPPFNYVFDALNCMKTVVVHKRNLYCIFALDVDDIQFVINFDFPQCDEDYVHRLVYQNLNLCALKIYGYNVL